MCSACGKSGLIISNPARKRTVTPVSTDCSYTLVQLQNWKEKLKCVKKNGAYTQAGIDTYTLNSYTGIVQSAINYIQNPCYFKEHLDKIYLVIQQIVQLNLCTTN